jgi:hypothetical protein
LTVNSKALPVFGCRSLAFAAAAAVAITTVDHDEGVDKHASFT